jgi:hypothetical protein
MGHFSPLPTSFRQARGSVAPLLRALARAPKALRQALWRLLEARGVVHQPQMMGYFSTIPMKIHCKSPLLMVNDGLIIVNSG